MKEVTVVVSHHEGDTLVLIPARGGSKRLPGKNLKLLAGKPLIAYTIEAALEADLGLVVVSTDDPAIARESRKFGAHVPFLRPPELASDTALSIDVAVHCLNTLGGKYATVIFLQPTSPLRKCEDIVGAMSIYEEHQSEAVVSVCESRLRPEWLFEVRDGYLQESNARKSNVTRFVSVNGAIYIVDQHILIAKRTFLPERTMPYVMPQERSVDIDTLLDFKIAEYLLSKCDS